MQTRQTDLARLLMGTKVFVVPQFQRHYKWKQEQWVELYEDVFEQYDAHLASDRDVQPSDGHFLGSVVLHPAPGPASTVAKYWVIDGQQRLTTLIALIAAIRDVRHSVDPDWNPASYDDLYLVNPYHPNDRFKLVPGDNDRVDFDSTIYGGEPKGNIGNAYKWFKSALIRRNRIDPIDFVVLDSALLLRVILVELNTSVDDNINQIFHTINHAGMKLTAIDLIRNHAFMQFERETSAEIHERLWRPMERKLGSEKVMSRYFWAQLVRKNPKATQRDLYSPYYQLLANEKRSGERADMSAIVSDQLETWLTEVEIFRGIEDPWSRAGRDWTPRLIKALRDLATWGSQTYTPIALELLSRFNGGRVAAAEVSSALEHVLSFLVRRGLAGTPTNNLNRILSALPSSLSDSLAVDEQVREALGSSSRYWPTDRELADRALSTPLYLTLQPNQVKFILSELERVLNPNENVDPEFLTIEHILPQRPTAQWLEMLSARGFDKDVATSRTHVLGNLTLSGINSELARRTPTEKGALLAASNLALNRQLGEITTWTPVEIDARTQHLIESATLLWRRPALATSDIQPELAVLPEAFDLDSVLGALPGDARAAVADIAALTGSSPDDVEARARSLGFRIDRVVDLVAGYERSIIDLRESSEGLDDSADLPKVMPTASIVDALQALGSRGEPDQAE